MLWGYMQRKGWRVESANVALQKRDGTAKRKRCAYERDALSWFFLCPFGVINSRLR